jgi:hypothetical protein
MDGMFQSIKKTRSHDVTSMHPQVIKFVIGFSVGFRV